MGWTGRTPSQRTPTCPRTPPPAHKDIQALSLSPRPTLIHTSRRQGAKEGASPGWAPACPGRKTGPSWEGKKLRAKTLTEEKAEGATRPEENLRGGQRAYPTPPSREGGGLREPGRSPGEARRPV